MKRASLLLVSLLLVALVAAPTAEAKFSAASVCGPTDCRTVRADADHQLLAMERVAFSAESRLGAKPPHASGWYRVTLCPEACASRGALALKVLPGVGYAYVPPRRWEQVTGETFAPQNGWARMGEHAAAAYRGVTSDLEPFPASRLPHHLGAADPNSGPAAETGSTGTSEHGGIPAWGWIVIVAGATLAVLSPRLRSVWRRSPSAR